MSTIGLLNHKLLIKSISDLEDAILIRIVNDLNQTRSLRRLHANLNRGQTSKVVTRQIQSNEVASTPAIDKTTLAHVLELTRNILARNGYVFLKVINLMPPDSLML